MTTTEVLLKTAIDKTNTRLEFWVQFLKSTKIQRLVELGVYRGDFAAKVLKDCVSIKKYYMLDPWRHLDDWNKPANSQDDVFAKFLSETKAKTEFAAEKRVILRGKTTEVIDEIAEDELDFAYIDGDHTLKGIAIDLVRLYPKIKIGGWIGGDDFSRSVWQHSTKYEPTLVFPFAVYFAEAVGARIYALPHSQFLIEKSAKDEFAFVDLTGGYGDVGLSAQFDTSKVLKLKITETFSVVPRIARRVKRMVSK